MVIYYLKKQKMIKTSISQICMEILRNKAKKQKRALYNIETFYKARRRVIKLIGDHSLMISETTIFRITYSKLY